MALSLLRTAKAWVRSRFSFIHNPPPWSRKVLLLEVSWTLILLKTALIHDGLARGIREAAKALEKRQAHLCVLASNPDEPMNVKLVEALCAEHQINIIKMTTRNLGSGSASVKLTEGNL
ncbi:hypothetical protein P7K49_007610 [Saguinus oedipus]|uniref:40S ribosomal protein S12 n=1 Tax=Saguinus oedipus TaxID=9490 RepID=A0ABQ9VVD7_SAGOE|nr:hypothetical protein P7K49_007610 [Saguinus oedipus]